MEDEFGPELIQSSVPGVEETQLLKDVLLNNVAHGVGSAFEIGIGRHETHEQEYDRQDQEHGDACSAQTTKYKLNQNESPLESVEIIYKEESPQRREDSS